MGIKVLVLGHTKPVRPAERPHHMMLLPIHVQSIWPAAAAAIMSRRVGQHNAGLQCRQWIKEVLQPLNQRASEAITQRADLLESSMMEPLLLQLVAHVSAFKVILRR